MNDLLFLIYALSPLAMIMAVVIIAVYFYCKAKYEVTMAEVDQANQLQLLYTQNYSNVLSGKENAFSSWISTHMGLPIEQVRQARMEFDQMYKVSDSE
jgi:hypothetical protein